MVADNRVWFGRDGQSRPAIKRFLSEVKQGRVAQTFWPYEEVGHNQDAKKELLARVEFTDGDTVFDTPKPTKLIRRMLTLATSKDSEDIVLDFFAGSGTTADAVLQQNAEDGGKRRFILVQLPDDGDGRSKGIPAVARERIRNAGIAVADSAGLDARRLDLGFRSLSIDTTNLTDVTREPDETNQLSLAELEPSIKSDRTEEDLLFQVLLDWGLELTMPIVKETVDGHEIFDVEEGTLIACLDKSLTQEVVHSIAAREPIRAVFRDDGFDSDSQRINVEQIFREVSPSTEVKAI